MNNLNELSKSIYEANKEKGFDVSKDNKGQVLMLIVSELAEALEADRENKYANLEVFEKHIEYKLKFNTTRPYKHNKEY